MAQMNPPLEFCRALVVPRALVLLVLFLFLAGCVGADPAAGPSPGPAGSQGSAASPQPAPTPSTVEDRCHVAVPGKLVQTETPDGSVLTGASFGAGANTAILLHQDSASGLCGFILFGRWAADHGVGALAFDVCGYGRASCNPDLLGDPVSQLRAMVAYARRQGARRVTLVGASMGGALALGAGQRAGADAVVNLSGPAYWDDVPSAADAARATTVPLLVVAADSDRGISASALRAAVRASPARFKRYVAAPKGHGTAVLSDESVDDPRFTPAARIVLGWVKGRYGP